MTIGSSLPQLISLACKRRAIPVVDFHVARSPLVAAPLLGAVDGGLAGFGRLEQLESLPDDAFLHCHVPWPPAGVAQGEVDEQESRHAAVLHDVEGRANDHRGHAVLF